MQGTELKNLRHSLGLTLEQLARELYHPTTFKRVSTSTVSKWERSTMVITLPSWVDMAAAAMKARIMREAGIKAPAKPRPLGKLAAADKAIEDARREREVARNAERNAELEAERKAFDELVAEGRASRQK